MPKRIVAKRKPQHALGRAPLDRETHDQLARAALAANVPVPHYVNILGHALEMPLHLLSGSDQALPRPNQPWIIAARTPICEGAPVRGESN